MKIRTVSILGAGAIGAYLIEGLSPKKEITLSVVAKGERKERLTAEGVVINGMTYKPAVLTPEEARGADLLIVCLKYNALSLALDDIAAIVDDHTIVMSLMNGVDSEEVIGGRVGMDHMVWSMIKIASHRIGNEIRFPLPRGRGGIYLGEPGMAGTESEKVAAICEALGGTSLCLHPSDRILDDIWSKYALNVSRNIPQAILGVGVGAYEDSEYCAALVKHLEDEVFAVAAAKGLHPDPVYVPRIGFVKDQRYSTLQDIDAGRRTEVDMFCGAMIRMGRELGIPTPYCECTYYLIKTLEEKNEGRFNY